jgi:hypothetical protein
MRQSSDVPIAGNANARRAGRNHDAWTAKSNSTETNARSLNAACMRRLHAITNTELSRLSSYADYRLKRVGVESELGQDLVQDAILAILIGMQGLLNGRHPRTDDVKDDESFRRYLFGVIRSLVAAQALRRKQWAPANCFDDRSPNMPDILISYRTPAESADGAILARGLFAELRLRIPPRARDMVERWAAEYWWTEEIPLAGRPRKDRRLVRNLSQKILGELNTRHDAGGLKALTRHSTDKS